MTTPAPPPDFREGPARVYALICELTPLGFFGGPHAYVECPAGLVVVGPVIFEIPDGPLVVEHEEES